LNQEYLYNYLDDPSSVNPMHDDFVTREAKKKKISREKVVENASVQHKIYETGS